MSKNEQFGHPGLINGEIAPVPHKHRIMGLKPLVRLWTVVALAPATYAFAVVQVKLPVAMALVALATGLVVGASVGVVLSRPALRYGVGFVAISRAALGPRGAVILLAARWWIGFVFVAGWALEVGSWTRKLFLVALSWFGLDAAGPVAEGLAWHLPGDGGIAGVTWALSAGFLLLAWPVARRGMSGLGRWILAGGATALVASCGLVVYGGIRSRGFGDAIKRAPDWDAVDFTTAALAATVIVLPAVISAADWARFRAQRARRRVLTAMAPLSIMPAALVLTFVGALLASASFVVRGSADGSPIPDAAGFGNFDAGAGGVLLYTGVWLAAGPLIGLYSPALALCGMFPRLLGYRRAVGLTTLLAVLALPVPGYLAVRGWGLGDLGLLVAAPIGVLLTDELLVRRGRLLLEELYLYKSEYGPVFGVTLTGVLALAAGWVFHPRILTLIERSAPGAVPGLARLLRAQNLSLLAPLAGAVVAGALFLLLVPLERFVARRLRARFAGSAERTAKKQKKRKKKKGKRNEQAGPQMLGPDDSALLEGTNPYFEYLPDGSRKEGTGTDPHPALDPETVPHAVLTPGTEPHSVIPPDTEPQDVLVPPGTEPYAILDDADSDAD